jgi:hypothetical protein
MGDANPYATKLTGHARVAVCFLVFALVADAVTVAFFVDSRHGPGVAGAAELMIGMMIGAGGMLSSAIGAVVACGTSRRWRGGGERTVARLCLFAMAVTPAAVAIAFS